MMNSLDVLGWDEQFQREYDAAREALGDDDRLVPARVSADFGMQLEVVGPAGRRRAHLVGKFLGDEDARPAVGDWVILRPLEDGGAMVVELLPRRSRVARQAAMERTKRQIIGANLDVVFVVSSLNQEFNPRRIERFLTAVREGGATPVVVLNKADLVDEPQDFVDEVRESAPEVDVVVTSAAEETGISQLRDFLEQGMTFAFVGSSGVGKSSLINQLSGDEVMAVGDVRDVDNKGRHTTTHRQLLLLPGGALVVDTPGMREFQVWSGDEGLDEVFEDIEELAWECRFRDCKHLKEPGCAVRAAVEAGELAPDRLAQYHKLTRELEQLEQRKREAARRSDERQIQRIGREMQELKKRYLED